MNLKELKKAFIILKSQKLIDFYDIEIYKNENQKLYKTYFKTYNWIYYCINFNSKIKDNIKELIYNNYIKY